MMVNKNMKPGNIDVNLILLSVLVLLLPMQLNSTTVNPACPQHRKHFVLVHGACHGAWSWNRLIPLLKSAGHHVTALDMEAQGINPVQIADIRNNISDYFHPLREFMASIPPNERVVLVGHSYGGLGIAQAMEMFPDKISVAVFLAAFMIGPSLNISTYNQQLASRTSPPQLDNIFIYGNGTSNPPTAYTFGPIQLATNLYQRSPREDLELAKLLVRPIYRYNDPGLSKELVVTTQKYGSVSRVAIIGDEDRTRLNKNFQQWVFQQNPPNEVFNILGADHMVMYSKPLELFFRLQDIAAKYS